MPRHARKRRPIATTWRVLTIVVLMAYFLDWGVGPFLPVLFPKGRHILVMILLGVLSVFAFREMRKEEQRRSQQQRSLHEGHEG